MNKPITCGHITRWLLLIQEFDITIVDKPRKDNVVVYFLSRLDTSDEGAPVEDSFQDEHLFAISTHTLWYVDIATILLQEKYLNTYHTESNEGLSIIFPAIGG